jgi:hypothetical protein
MNNEEKEYCLVSKEILLFIEWLLVYDTKLLDNLIKKVWKNGFEKLYFEEIQKKEKSEGLDPQQTILDFFFLLENSITTLAKQDTEKKNNVIKKILDKDFSIIFDNNTDYQNIIEKSLLKSQENQTDEKETIKNKFYKNFLQNWDPNNTLIE